MKRRSILIFSLISIAAWWTFQMIWLSASMHTVAALAYRSEPLTIPGETARLARERALQYSTRGGSASDDIYFTKAEVSHLTDVSRLYNPIQLSLNILALVSWSILLLAVYQRWNLVSSLRLAGRVIAGMVAVLVFCAGAFPFFFLRFHQILFPQGNWAFPADSVLIQIFPESFWKLELIFLLVLLAVFSVLYTVLARQLTTSAHE